MTVTIAIAMTIAIFTIDINDDIGTSIVGAIAAILSRMRITVHMRTAINRRMCIMIIFHGRDG